MVKEVATQIANDGSIPLGAVVFDAPLDMSVISAGSFPTATRAITGHSDELRISGVVR